MTPDQIVGTALIVSSVVGPIVLIGFDPAHKSTPDENPVRHPVKFLRSPK